MAKVDYQVDGMPIQEFIAKLPGVRGVIVDHTQAIGAKAKALKADRVDTGASFIEIDLGGDVDGQVVLNDEAGLKAAMAMEYGSDPHEGFPDGTPAQLILHDASGIPLKRSFPRSRRRKKYQAPSRRKKRRR